jgi:hypothetical protein
MSLRLRPPESDVRFLLILDLMSVCPAAPSTAQTAHDIVHD